MTYTGRLIEVGSDNVGFIESDQLDYLYGVQVSQIANLAGDVSESNYHQLLEGKWVEFEILGDDVKKVTLLKEQNAGA